MREHPGINRPAHFHWRVTVLQMQWAIQALGAIAAHRPSASGQGGRGAGRLLALLLLGLLGEGGRRLASAQPACESAPSAPGSGREAPPLAGDDGAALAGDNGTALRQKREGGGRCGERRGAPDPPCAQSVRGSQHASKMWWPRPQNRAGATARGRQGAAPLSVYPRGLIQKAFELPWERRRHQRTGRRECLYRVLIRQSPQPQ